MDYEKWYQYIRSTKIDKSHGIKVYKHVLLLAMLQRGPNNWWKPITPSEAAPFFHRIMTDNDAVRDLSFADKEKVRHWYHYDEKFMATLIKNNPMKYWGDYSKYANGKFWFDLLIPENKRNEVFEQTKLECKKRINQELGTDIDFRVDIRDEYNYIYNQLNHGSVSESEKESYVKVRLTQGKFRNRLMEKYDNCLICSIENPKILIGSHIKPWRISDNFERVDVNNGLLLCPNHDKLFDRGLVSFNGEGRIIISPELEKYNDIRPLLLDDIHHIEVSSNSYHYLSYHRNNVFVK
jgi:hypothetical protein